MSKNMVSNFLETDEYLIYNFDTFSIALEYGIDPSVVEAWTEEKLSWAKTVLKIRKNLENDK